PTPPSSPFTPAPTPPAAPAAASQPPPRDQPDHATIDAILRGDHHDPHGLLGPHPVPGGVAIRTLRPLATSVTVVTDSDRFPLQHVHDGVFSAVLPLEGVTDYRLEVDHGLGPVREDDPYRFL